MKNSLHPRSFALRARKVLSTVIQPAVFGLLLANVQAGNTWTGGGGSTNWSDSNNWGGAAPVYGTLTFTTGGAQGTTSVNNSITAQNRLLWTGSSSWTLNNSGGTVLSLFDFGGTQAKIENQSTGLVTINAPITFANTNATNPFGEINAVNGDITFGTGTLTVNGSQVNGVKLFGSGRTTTFNNTVSSTGKWFGLTGANTTMDVGGAFTSGDIYAMNGGTVKLNSGGTITTSALRLGGDFGNTGNQNQTLGGTLQFTSLTGGQSFSSIINTVTGNTSNALLIDSLNTSGTNTLSGASFLDSDLKTQVANGGTLSFTGGSIDVKIRKLTIGGAGTTIINEPLTSSFGAGGFLVKEGSGTLVLQGTANSYTGTNSATLNANGTQIAAGTLAIAGDTSLGIAPAGAYNNVQFTGTGTLRSDASISLNVNRNISIASGATGTFDSNGNTFTINGIVNGAGGNVEKTGGGSVVFNVGNSYTGTTTVSQGTLQVNANNGLGTNAAGTVVSNGAALKLNGTSYSTAEALQINGTGVSGGGALVNSGVSSYAGQITAASNSLISAGGSTLTLSGGIVKNGTTVTLYGGPSGGAFNINTVGISGASANSDLIVDNASVALNVASTYDGPTYIRNAGTLNANVSNALPTSPRSAMILDDTGSGSSTLAIGTGTSNEIASLTGAASSILALTSSSSLAIGTGSGTTTFAGTIVGGPGTPIMKDGASTQILTGNSSTYQGVISISAGVLEANNTTGSASGTGGVSVSSGGTLAGTGRIEASAAAGFVFINGNLVVGSTVGAPAVADFEIANTGFALGTTLSVNSQLTMELFTGAGLGDNSGLSTSADRLKIVGNLGISGGAKFVLANPNAMTAWAVGDRWRVFDWSSVGTITGSFASIDTTLPTLGAGMFWDTSDLFTTSGAFSGTIDIEAVPEPGSLLVGIFCSLSVAIRRRRRRSAD